MQFCPGATEIPRGEKCLDLTLRAKQLIKICIKLKEGVILLRKITDYQSTVRFRLCLLTWKHVFLHYLSPIRIK